jgi:signal transduction histidine kinase
MKLRGEVIDPRTLPQTLVVARDAEPAHRALARLRWVLATGSLLTLGLGFVLIERAIRSSLRPIDQLSSQVQDRAGHQLDAALDLPEDLPLELTGLATNFDLLLTRVAAIRQRERDFIRHAAHELRTPIAGLRATTDLALSQSRDAAAYAAHLASCQKTAVELGELVKRLSAIARIGTAASPALKEKVDLSALAADSLSQFLSRMTERDLSVENTTKGKNLAALGDPALVRIVLNNLFDNAVSYAVRGGRIVVAGRSNADGVEIAVANTVEDFPEDPDRLFEPLFRREESRHDAASHLGIGLTLSLEAARAMGGSLRVGKTEEGMIAFCLVLPAVG